MSYENNQKLLVRRTINKLTKSQKNKILLLDYIEQHKPHLLRHSAKKRRIRECCNMAVFRKDLESWHKSLMSANFCKYDRICIACATKRAIRMIKRFEQWIANNSLYGKKRYYIVLTIKHTKDDQLKDLMEKLMEAKKVMARKYRNSKRSNHKNKSFFHYFDGMVISIEISHRWKNWRHPHINILSCSDYNIPVDIGKYRSANKNEPSKTNEKLKNEWLAITWDSYIHNIRKINVKSNHFTTSWIGEVFKYAIKFSDLSIPQLAEVMEIQNNKKYRFFSTYWIFRWWSLQTTEQKWGRRRDGIFLFDETTQMYELNRTIVNE